MYLDEPPVALADFTVTPATLRLLPVAALVGALGAGAALGLLDLIGLVTNLVWWGRVSTSLTAPGDAHVGAPGVLIPVAGGLVVGLMARFGSEQVRGHGIPEAMESILTGGSRIKPRLAVLKPVASAVAIGTGGPFGAEGPIILTGGALGSILAQLLRLTAVQRRTLLVAGACAGMAAVFGTPVAAVLFGVELLVFEWRPRSFVPIAVAVAAAAVVRDAMASGGLLAGEPLFPVAPHGTFGAVGVGESAVIGVATGLLALVLTTACYGAEDAFAKLRRLHWMWWPALGGLVVGIGGLVDGRALGVGYGVIAAELAGHLAIGALALLLVVKLVIWAVALGSGTSGGILAPLLMMGAALGGIIGHGFGGPTGTWALMGMAGALSGATRSPLTSIVFAFELTHDTGSLLPLLVTCALAHLVSTLVLKRSILTEKVARKGFHVMREYSVDGLEAVFVREAMRTDLLTALPQQAVGALRTAVEAEPGGRRQRLFPVLDGDRLAGVVGWGDLLDADDPSTPIAEVLHPDPVVAHPGETLRTVAERMAERGLGALPVVTAGGGLVGVITEWELLAGRRRQLAEERHAERVLRLRVPARRT